MPDDVVEIRFYVRDEMTNNGAFTDTAYSWNGDKTTMMFEYPGFEGSKFAGAIVECFFDIWCVSEV